MSLLQDAPTTPWLPEGGAAFGTFRGECSALGFDARFGRLERIRAQKRWLWCGVMTDDVAVGIALVRTGYAANVFCWVFDRRRGEFLHDISRVLPRAAVDVAHTPAPEGRVARYRGLVEGVDFQRSGELWTLRGTIGDVMLDLEIREHGVPMTAICPTAFGANDRVNVTRKQGLATASGAIRSGTQRFELRDAATMLDHSHGMLSGETVWQWAIGAGTFVDTGESVAFNFVASFNDELENVIWLNDEPGLAGPLVFDIPEDHADVWRVSGERMDLAMVPEALRAQDLDLGLVASEYLQPLGLWTGTIDGREVRALGVAELHRSVW